MPSSKRQTAGDGGPQSHRPQIEWAAGLPKGGAAMFDKIQYHVMQAWDVWSGLFQPLPYGDPYIAMGVLIAAFIFGTKWFIEGSVSGA